MSSTTEDDQTTRARIRDAAIRRFATDGVAGTTVRAIAAAAGVSAGLVIHHFGSKDALRVACDQYVAATVRRRKSAASAQGVGLDVTQALRDHEAGPPLLRYLARTLVDGSPHVVELVDELVDDAVAYMETGVASGMLTPTEWSRERAVVVTIWSLGSLVLHEHLERLLGVDITGPSQHLGPYAVPATEVFAKGLMHPAVYERVRDAFARAEETES